MNAWVSLLGVFSSSAPVGHLTGTYDRILSDLLQTLIFLANVAGGTVVGVAIVRGLVIYVFDLVRLRGADVPKEGIRLSLGRSLALALEFQLGADILGTALNPSLGDIGILAAIVVLRTVLNFFLQRELAEAQRREAEGQSAATSRSVNSPLPEPVTREM